MIWSSGDTLGGRMDRALTHRAPMPLVRVGNQADLALPLLPCRRTATGSRPLKVRKIGGKADRDVVSFLVWHLHYTNVPRLRLEP